MDWSRIWNPKNSISNDFFFDTRAQVPKAGTAAFEEVEKRIENIEKEVGMVNARLRASHLSRAETGRIPTLYNSLLSQEMCKSPENIDSVVMQKVNIFELADDLRACTTK